MPYNMIHSSRFKKSADIINSLNIGFNFYIARFITDGGFVQCENNSLINENNKILKLPIAYNVRSMNSWNDFDIYTGNVSPETLFIIGQNLKVFDDRTFYMPYSNLEFNSILSDFFITSFLFLCKGDFEQAYCYLRCVQFIISLANEKSKDFIQDSCNLETRTVKLFKL